MIDWLKIGMGSNHDGLNNLDIAREAVYPSEVELLPHSTKLKRMVGDY